MAVTEQAKSRKENTMPTNDEKPNIYPPSIIDPLLPGGIPSTPDGTEKLAPDPDAVARDRYLGELAREAEAEVPCAQCGKYTVKPGGVCPGCGAVR
jgi:hypothetical protein